MLRRTALNARRLRPYYNLANKTPGRMLTGFMTPYRHWMWKQGELWRNVHEAQFEHMRLIYRRQWYEAYRVNSDEYIHKYNITKAAQLTTWEHEMHAQEAKRIESMHMSKGRAQLKRKHMDLLREYYERQFFQWYERASERLQYMQRIPYVHKDNVAEHIEKELDKYVTGRDGAYPLNFIGQMPLLEDSDGNVAQVPEGLMTNHFSERQTSEATVYVPPGSKSAEDQLKEDISGDISALEFLRPEEAAAFSRTIEDAAKQEQEVDDKTKVARSMEETEADRLTSREKYIARGNVGAKNVYRKQRSVDDGGALPPSSPSRPRIRRLQDEILRGDRSALEQLRSSAKGEIVTPSIGEAAKAVGLKHLMKMPTLEEAVKVAPEIAGQAAGRKMMPNMKEVLKKKRDDARKAKAKPNDTEL